MTLPHLPLHLTPVSYGHSQFSGLAIGSTLTLQALGHARFCAKALQLWQVISHWVRLKWERGARPPRPCPLRLQRPCDHQVPWQGSHMLKQLGCETTTPNTRNLQLGQDFCRDRRVSLKICRSSQTSKLCSYEFHPHLALCGIEASALAVTKSPSANGDNVALAMWNPFGKALALTLYLFVPKVMNKDYWYEMIGNCPFQNQMKPKNSLFLVNTMKDCWCPFCLTFLSGRSSWEEFVCQDARPQDTKDGTHTEEVAHGQVESNHLAKLWQIWVRK